MTPRKHTVARSIINALIVGINLLAGIALVIVAHAGNISPIEHPLAGVVLLAFPMLLAAVVVLLVADLFLWRKTSLIPLIAIAMSWPLVRDTCPLNIAGGGIPSGTPVNRVFTMLTYNVYNMCPRREFTGYGNPYISYILKQDADIVCLQELHALSQTPGNKITPEQLDSLNKRYPYIILSGYAVGVLSKYPVTNLHLDPRSGVPGNFCDIAAYVVEVEGHRLAIFNLHLQSYNLSSNDKAAYKELTELKGEENLRATGSQLLGKLEKAAAFRAAQADMLCRFIEYYGGENVVVCGDFNDVPGCYTLRKLNEAGLKEVWPEVAFGPTHTYNDNRFYFRIDHMLWRGRMQPADIRRGNIIYSDHYPLLATFVWDDDAPADD